MTIEHLKMRAACARAERRSIEDYMRSQRWRKPERGRMELRTFDGLLWTVRGPEGWSIGGPTWLYRLAPAVRDVRMPTAGHAQAWIDRIVAERAQVRIAELKLQASLLELCQGERTATGFAIGGKR